MESKAPFKIRKKERKRKTPTGESKHKHPMKIGKPLRAHFIIKYSICFIKPFSKFSGLRFNNICYFSCQTLSKCYRNGIFSAYATLSRQSYFVLFSCMKMSEWMEWRFLAIALKKNHIDQKNFIDRNTWKHVMSIRRQRYVHITQNSNHRNKSQCVLNDMSCMNPLTFMSLNSRHITHNGVNHFILFCSERKRAKKQRAKHHICIDTFFLGGWATQMESMWRGLNACDRIF